MNERRTTERIYGRNAVIEALGGRRTLRHLFVAQGVERQERIGMLLKQAERRRIPIKRLPPKDLDRVAGDVNHQGVLLDAGSYPYVPLEHILDSAAGRPLLILDHIQDPQNLGTLMRSAEAANVGGLIVPDRRAASITPAVVNASSGAVEHLLVARVANLGRALDQVKEAGYWVAGLEADASATGLYETDVPDPTALVIGSEGKGMAPTLLRACDLVVQLPMLGRIESLNAAVAGSIALFEIVRRRMGNTD